MITPLNYTLGNRNDYNGKKDITELNLSSSGIDSNQAFDIVYAMEENTKSKLNKLDISNNELVKYEKVKNYANRPGQNNNLEIASNTPQKVKQNKMKNLKRKVSGMLNRFTVKSKSSSNVVAPSTRSRSNAQSQPGGGRGGRG
ncbi:MAG: hypothetical protein HRU35_07145 [Rickettsiaceae bacterium]|nr:hypothetical protein [Rickettsiaceae bacterium]